MKVFQQTASAILASSLIAGAAQAQISDDEIRIGYLADMSGTYRDLSGPGGLDALNMAIEDFGGQVNGKKIVVFSADDLNKPDVGANTVRQWVDERNVDMVTGMVASSVVLAASKVVEQAGKLALISGAAASSLTNEYCSPNHIHWTYDSYALANGTAKAVLANGGKSWFILTADYAFGHAMETDITKVVEAGGGSVVSKVRHPFPGSDFSMLAGASSATGLGSPGFRGFPLPLSSAACCAVRATLSTVWAGRPYMRSKFTLVKPASRRNSLAALTRPKVCNRLIFICTGVAKSWTPKLMRLKPMPFSTLARSRVSVSSCARWLACSPSSAARRACSCRFSCCSAVLSLWACCRAARVWRKNMRIPLGWWLPHLTRRRAAGKSGRSSFRRWRLQPVFAVAGKGQCRRAVPVCGALQRA